MYSLGILGSWWLKTFCSAMSHNMVCFGTFSVKEFEMTWKWMSPLASSSLAASSRGACSGRMAVGPEKCFSKHLYFNEHLFIYFMVVSEDKGIPQREQKFIGNLGKNVI